MSKKFFLSENKLIISAFGNLITFFLYSPVVEATSIQDTVLTAVQESGAYVNVEVDRDFSRQTQKSIRCVCYDSGLYWSDNHSHGF